MVGVDCPQGASTAVDHVETTRDGGILRRRLDCRECGTTFDALYEPVGVERVSETEARI